MAESYFSDREFGAKPRDSETITPAIWGGIIFLVDERLQDGSFGKKFPEGCYDDKKDVIGANPESFYQLLQVEVPGIELPLNRESVPPIQTVMDLIEFCYKYVAKPIEAGYHNFFGHYHLRFEAEEGRIEFRQAINLIFARNGIALELSEVGEIVRLLPTEFQVKLDNSIWMTGDNVLDDLLDTARKKILHPSVIVRKEGVEKLWDAWERLKTIEASDKKRSVEQLLTQASDALDGFKEVLDEEAKALTNIGNMFMIRHTETDKKPIENREQIDYLFLRLFSLIHFLLRRTGRLSERKSSNDSLEEIPF